MKDLTFSACECLKTVPDTLDPERINMELGLCIITAASPYKKQLYRDYKIDFNKISEQGEELGIMIGVEMASVCPDILIKMVNKANEKKDANMSENHFEGQITAIVDDKFVEFSIKDELGKISKYHWLTYIESNTDLSTDYKNLIYKSVKIVFISQEYFDPRIGEYRTFNIIQHLEVINN